MTTDAPHAPAPFSPTGEWETVIGLEVHCELRTATKLFCGCRNAFGDEPNTNVCPVCLGLPGSLPVLNRMAVEYAMRIGLALHCRVEPSIFHRKNYFYPDMPKDYQVSQYDRPINVDGWLALPTGRRIGIERAHMEEDTGKTTHVGGGGRIHDAGYSLVDYNRAGVPLVEIVSRPDLRSAAEARYYVDELRGILVATGASDGKMEEGSLRVDANVSVRPMGSTEFGTRTEIKNMNSMRSLGRAIDYEVTRQISVLTSGGRVVQETRHWNEADGSTRSMRSKEEAFDYRYFPEPDLVPLAPPPEWVSAVAAALPALPADRRARVAAASGLPVDSDAVATVVHLDLDGFVTAAAAAGADAALAVRRLANEVAASGDSAHRLSADGFTQLLLMESQGSLTTAQAREVLRHLLATGGSPSAVAASLGFEALAADALGSAVDEVIAAHPDEWGRFVAGEDKLQGFFIGQVKAATGGKADLKVVSSLLRARRSGA
ncbi:MAG TPA: Asp-tRNA(Asn)/Glu-tRNA(Gln) amidotransferase subunit GatB [Acidimicrobiales bacterium]|jgi:aspartyl-tRNA(Asn)/glutamyl-tRNA(Gln) amidotransferase subunit B|nr:Asp-tRNA(Asn)/Glu-tRNA(Gln) amidotransferase subunit GatB [Acidimicrobiales bacterium]